MMRKVLATVFAMVLAVSLFSITAYAGISNSTDGAGNYYADGKAAYPDDYTNIYGMSVSYTVETPGPMGTGIGIAFGEAVKAFDCDQAVVDLAAMFGVALPMQPRILENVVEGYRGTIRFLDGAPLFTADGDTVLLIGVQPDQTTGADPTIRINSVIWLDADGRDIGNPDAPKTGHPGNALLWGILGVSCVGGTVVVVRLSSLKKGKNAA